MTVDKMTVEKMTVDKMTVHKMTVDKMTVDKMTVDKMTFAIRLTPELGGPLGRILFFKFASGILKKCQFPKTFSLLRSK
jgi:hypothetical protein